MNNKTIRIVELTGGLGNQMFQYAFGKYLKKEFPNDEIKYDLRYYNADNAIRKYALSEAFGLDIDEAANCEIRKIKGFDQYDSRALRLLRCFQIGKKGIVITENLDEGYDGNIVLNDENTYYSGYWQSEKYFHAFRNEILEDFSFRLEKMTAECEKIYHEISSKNAVAVHVRLEDYLSKENSRIYGNICTKEYYAKAIYRIKQIVGECVFYVFSTDMEMALGFLPKTEEYYPVIYSGQSDYMDMYLMTSCNHNIIANSTFSWWGAWLNKKTGKVVICPDRWFNNHDMYNQYCKGWMKI